MASTETPVIWLKMIALRSEHRREPLNTSDMCPLLIGSPQSRINSINWVALTPVPAIHAWSES